MTRILQTLFKILRYLLLRRYVAVPLAILLGIYVLITSATDYVGPSEVGVRQVNYGTSSGIQRRILYTGTHLVLPGYERVHHFPTDIQVLDMSNNKETGAVGRSMSPVNIQTSDGYQVTIDATALYRVKDPYAVITKIGPGRLYEDSLVIPRTDKALRQALGELNSEEFYQADKRIQHIKQASDQLSKEMGEHGVELVKLLVRRIVYDRAYQQQIEQRKIQDQMVYKNRAEGAAAKEEAHKREIISLGQAAVKVEIERGARERAKILADANLEKRSKDADGDLLIKTAEATGIELENRALQGAGASSMVGQRLADVLKGIKVIVVPSNGAGGTNPLDVGSLLRQFEVGK